MTDTALLTQCKKHLPVISKAATLGCLQITGNDAVKFLQGQTTCDFTTLTPEQSLFGAICNIKGRVITNFYAVQHEEKMLLIMSRDLVELTHQHLKKYAVFFKADMVDVSEQYSLNFAFLAEPLAAPSESYFITEQHDEHLCVSISHSPFSHYLCVSPITQTSASLAESLSTKTGADIAVADELAGISILNGQPLINAEASEKFIPQMLNMQLTQGVNFKKGCYAGQEIVARMQYRGNLKKRAYLFSHDSTDDNDIPAPLTRFSNPDGRDVAEVVQSVSLLTHTVCLAVIGDKDAEADVLLNNTPLEKEVLPYSLPKEE